MTLRFLTAGESHGPGLVGIVEGLPAGLPVDPEAIDGDLARRQIGVGRSARMKIEHDRAEILAGVVGGRTIGAPVALTIHNLDYANWQGKTVPPQTVPRPGHADLAGALKYGLDDLRLVGERASARETAMRVACGALARLLLAEFGVAVGSQVLEIGGVQAEVPERPYPELWARARASEVAVADGASGERIATRIREAMHAGDSVGGVIEIVALNVPVGLGSHVHWDRRLDGRLAQAVMSIQSVKGVEIGPAFANAGRLGTEVQDEILPGDSPAPTPPPSEGEGDGEGPLRPGNEANLTPCPPSLRGKGERGSSPPLPLGEGWGEGPLQPNNPKTITRASNRAGGLEGGITNGMPVVVRAALKPLSTTVKPLRSVDLATGEPAPSKYQRSDFCHVPRACVIGEAMVAWVLAEALTEKLGGDSLSEMKARWEAWR